MSKTPPLVHNTLITHSPLNRQAVVSTVLQLYLRSASEHPSEREIQDIPPSSHVPCQDTQLLQAQHKPFAQQPHQTPQKRRKSWDTDPGTSLGNKTVEWESPSPVTLLSLKINCCLSAPQNHHSNKWEKRSTCCWEGLFFVFTFKNLRKREKKNYCSKYWFKPVENFKPHYIKGTSPREGEKLFQLLYTANIQTNRYHMAFWRHEV